MDEEKKEVVFKSNKIRLSLTNGDNNKYYENNEELIKENNQPYEEADFRNLIHEETQRFVQQNFSNIVVLFGAGASVTNNEYTPDEEGFAKTGLTVLNIAKQIFEQLKKGTYTLGENVVEVYSLDKIAKISSYSDNIIDENGNLSHEFNLEDFLSNLFAFEKFMPDTLKEKLLNTKDVILDIIVKSTSYDYNSETFKHVKLLNILSDLIKSDNKLNLVSTNYDTLIEDAAETMKWTVFDGFSFSQSPQFDSTMFDWNLVKDVPNVKTNENIYKRNVVNLLKIHGSLTWELSPSETNIVRKSKEHVTKPILIFPSSDKFAKSYQEPYFDLFNKFQNLLQKPNTLLITIGFSFADDHIARMILNAIRTNNSLASLITDYNIESENKNWEELETVMNEYYNVAFLKATLHDKLTIYLGDSKHDN